MAVVLMVIVIPVIVMTGWISWWRRLFWLCQWWCCRWSSIFACRGRCIIAICTRVYNMCKTGECVGLQTFPSSCFASNLVSFADWQMACTHRHKHMLCGVVLLPDLCVSLLKARNCRSSRLLNIPGPKSLYTVDVALPPIDTLSQWHYDTTPNPMHAVSIRHLEEVTHDGFSFCDPHNYTKHLVGNMWKGSKFNSGE